MITSNTDPDPMAAHSVPIRTAIIKASSAQLLAQVSLLVTNLNLYKYTGRIAHKGGSKKTCTNNQNPRSTVSIATQQRGQNSLCKFIL